MTCSIRQPRIDLNTGLNSLSRAKAWSKHVSCVRLVALHPASLRASVNRSAGMVVLALHIQHMFTLSLCFGNPAPHRRRPNLHGIVQRPPSYPAQWQRDRGPPLPPGCPCQFTLGWTPSARAFTDHPKTCHIYSHVDPSVCKSALRMTVKLNLLSRTRPSPRSEFQVIT